MVFPQLLLLLRLKCPSGEPNHIGFGISNLVNSSAAVYYAFTAIKSQYFASETDLPTRKQEVKTHRNNRYEFNITLDALRPRLLR